MAINNDQAKRLFWDCFPFFQSLRIAQYQSVTDSHINKKIQTRLQKVLMWDKSVIGKIAQLFQIYFKNIKIRTGEFGEESSLTINFENLTQKGRHFYRNIPFNNFFWAIVDSEYITFQVDELKNGWEIFELSTSKLIVFAGESVKFYRDHSIFEESKIVENLQSDVYKIRKTLQMYYPIDIIDQTSGEEVQRWGTVNLNELFQGVDEGGGVFKCLFFNYLEESSGRGMIRLNSVDLLPKGSCSLLNNDCKKYSTLFWPEWKNLDSQEYREHLAFSFMDCRSFRIQLINMVLPPYPEITSRLQEEKSDSFIMKFDIEICRKGNLVEFKLCVSDQYGHVAEIQKDKLLIYYDKPVGNDVG